MPNPGSSDSPTPANSAGPVREVELKLLLNPEDLKRIGGHPLIEQGGRPITKRLRSVYYDTPDLYLWRRGFTLRVRRGGGYWTQTVKGGGSTQGGIHRRLELETRLAGPTPDCRAVRDGELARLFSSRRLREALEPVFVTEVSRSTRVLRPASATVVEVCIDRGHIRARDAVESICEIELELKSGAVSDLYKLALTLSDIVHLHVENRSKAERGYALFRNERILPVKGRSPALSPDMSAGDSFGAIMWATLEHLQANERGVLGSRDPEFLHQVRVSLRRLRSALGVFTNVLPEAETASFKSEFKWLAGILGPARDWDVFITETLPLIQRECGDHPGLSIFAERCARARILARRRVREALASRRYRSLVLKFCAWLSDEPWLRNASEAAGPALRAPIPVFAASVLDRRYARVRKRGRKLEHLSPAELHRLRIAIKKLRYAAAFFATLYDAGRARKMLTQTTRLQDILGTINDAATVSRLIGIALGTLPVELAGEVRGIVMGWSTARAVRLKSALQTAWGRFRHIRRFW